MSNRLTTTSTISSAGAQNTINTQQQQQSVVQEYLDDSLWSFIIKTELDKLPLAVNAVKLWAGGSDYWIFHDLIAGFYSKATVDQMQYEENDIVKYLKDCFNTQTRMIQALKY